MSALQPSIFETIFKQSLAPAIIIKADAPQYTVIAQNRQYQLAMARTEDDLSGKSAYEFFVTDPGDKDQLAAYHDMLNALDEAINYRTIVKLAVIKSLVDDKEAGDRALWQQIQVVPVLDESGAVAYFYCPTYDISEEISMESARHDSLTKEQNLTEELAASNEELSATNEELSASNEELRQSQESLADINRELEHRVEQRTQALSESEVRFRSMVEQSPVPMLVTMGKVMIFDIINQPMLDLIGKDESVIGMPWNEAMPELEGQDIIGTLLDTYDSGHSWEGNEVSIVIHKNGIPQVGFYNITYKPLIERGEIIGMLQSAIDVTDQVKSRLLIEDMIHEQQAINEELTAANEELASTNSELDSTKQTLEQIIHILPASVVVISGNNLIVESINQANLTYWNKTAEQVAGRPLLEILPELDSQVFPSQLRQVMLTGEVIDVKESRVLFSEPDGSKRETFVDYTYQPLADRDGSFSRVLVMSFDITDRVASRKLLEEYSDEMQSLNEELTASNEELAAVNDELINAQQLVEESQTALRLAIDAAEFGTWYLHSVTREFITNARLKELFGYYPDEVLTIEGALGQINDEYRGSVASAIENAVYHNGDYDVTYPVTGLHDGRLRWLRAIGNLTADPSGAFSAFTGVVMDITEPYLAAKKVADAEENLRLATESGELATWYLNENLDKISASPRFNELFGFPQDEEITYLAAMEQVLPEYRDQVIEAVNASFESGEHFRVEYALASRDGKKRWIRSVGKFVADQKNGNYITGVMADITEQKTDEIRKNDFIGMVSHELKTPLTSLNGYLQMLQRKSTTSQDAFTAGALEQSVKQVKRMTTMINGFLNVSRLESGKIYIDKSTFNMTDLLKETELETASLYSGYNFIFHPVEPTMINADQDKIGQVINNFISNAVKYSKTGTAIRISCVTVGTQATVSVSDEGMGIKNEDLPRLFDRYFRVAANNHISGFGIGLYLSAEIIARHGGRIWAESDPGLGSTFYFSLPVIVNS